MFRLYSQIQLDLLAIITWRSHRPPKSTSLSKQREENLGRNLQPWKYSMTIPPDGTYLQTLFVFKNACAVHTTFVNLHLHKHDVFTMLSILQRIGNSCKPESSTGCLTFSTSTMEMHACFSSSTGTSNRIGIHFLNFHLQSQEEEEDENDDDDFRSVG